MDCVERPFVAVVGGAKVSDKLGIIRTLLDKVQSICIGGAMAYTFLKAQGHSVGTSRVEEDQLDVAKKILAAAKTRGVDFLLPSDHVVAAQFSESASAEETKGVDIADGMMGLDIGPQSRQRYCDVVSGAASFLWNGPMGVFEWERFGEGTFAIARTAAKCAGYTVVGGGDSVAAIEAAGVAAEVTHVSTGGGASLELLQTGDLPGLRVLRS